MILGIYLAAINGAFIFFRSRHAWRWYTGHPMHGKWMSNSSWFHRGNKALHPTGRVHPWHHLPRSVRAVTRSVTTQVTLVTVFGLVTATAVTVTALEAAGAVTLTGCSVMAVRWAVRFRHYRANVHPLHVSLGPPLGIPPERRAGDWLDVPRNYQTAPDSEIVLRLPDEFVPSRDAKQLVETTVMEKLALEDTKPEWQLAGKPRVVFKVSSPPPDKVLFDALRQAIEAAPDTVAVAGTGRGRKRIDIDLDNDSPHIMFSMGSGAGKSVSVRALATQVLHKGGIVLILDTKRHSHRWARGLPNVRYCRSAESIHDGLMWLGEEMDRRNQKADDAPGIEDSFSADVGPRILVVAEEMNATAKALRSYWRQIKPKGAPNESPAIEVLGDAFYMGRAIKVNVAAVAQMFSARICGPEARENMGTRVLGRYTMNNWRMLVPEIWPMPQSNRHRGRVQVCCAGVAEETQWVFYTPQECRDWATSGVVTPFPGTGSVVEATSTAPAFLTMKAEPVSIREACETGLLPGTYDTVRRALQRDATVGEAPEPVRTGPDGQKEYDPAVLRAWHANRPRTKVTT